MKTVILAGGTGRRVFPLAVNQPKPLFKLLGKPLIQHVIETLKSAKLKDFIVVVGHNGDQIKTFLGDGSNLNVHIDYAHQTEALGMADALKAAEELVDDHFFVVNADDVFAGSLITEMIEAFRSGQMDIVLACKPVHETWKYGIVQVEDRTVTRFVEKPPKGQEPSNLAVVGVYLMTKKIFDYYHQLPVSDHQYEDAIQLFIQKENRVSAIEYRDFFAGYKYPWDLFAINEYLMDTSITQRKIEENVHIAKDVEIQGNVWIRQGTRILNGTCIRGPCYIGLNTLIGNNCLVRDYTSIGNECTVGFSSEIKHSLIGDACSFHLNYIGDSIISDKCLFGAGTNTANFRFDTANIPVTLNDETVDSGRNKLGAIVSDNSQFGINAIILPGVKIGPYSIVGPGVILQQDLEPGKSIFADKRLYVVKANTITLSTFERQVLETKLNRYRKP